MTEHVHEDSDVSFRKRGKMDARNGIFISLLFIAHRGSEILLLFGKFSIPMLPYFSFQRKIKASRVICIPMIY